MDQEDEIILEEGELSNDSDEYTPLERPQNYSVSQPQPRLPVNKLSESEQSQSSSSDSDSDSKTKKNKKPRIKLKPGVQAKNARRKKYDIWSTRVQEEVLSETLNSCDVSKRDRSRNVESYDYTLGYKYYNEDTDTHDTPFGDEIDRKNNKRTRDDQKNTNFRQRKRSPSSEKVKGTKRIILDLNTDVNSDVESLAKDIANKLYEEKEDLISKVINAMGKKRAIEIFEETKSIEGDGGMQIMNQTRRRTPGGVYLFLVRHDYHITQAQKTEIFGEERQKYKQIIKAKQRIKAQKIKKEVAASRAKILPDLLIRAEAFVKQNTMRKVKETDESDFANPPPTPETDCHENSGDGMDEPSPPLLNGSDLLQNSSLENARGKLNTYDEEFLDIGCSADMDMF
ncbi:hypothetical protein JTB14_017410 [Gonioctena quinquepunctata]|nr:hypothetical protein JTB14_017410 [Gonioctena quinquepunctata]